MRKFFTILILLLVLFSCKEDFDVFIPDDPPITEPQPLNGDINRFFEAIAPEAQVFTFQAENGASIRTDNNVQFNIPGHAFADTNDDLVSGELRIEITEILKKGDMLLNRVSTEANEYLINSAGAFHIKVFKDGSAVQLATDKELNIQIPIGGEYSDDMEVFYGERLADGSFNWEEADNDPEVQNNVWLSEFFDSLSQQWGLSYDLYATQLEWINCDEFVNLDEGAKLSVEVPESYSDTNSVVYLVFEDLNAIMQLNWNDQEKIFTQNYIPLNEAVQLILIAEGADQRFYFSNLSTTISADEVISMSPEEIPLGDIVEFISGL
jgi:hypothetical protein